MAKVQAMSLTSVGEVQCQSTVKVLLATVLMISSLCPQQQNWIKARQLNLHISVLWACLQKCAQLKLFSEPRVRGLELVSE